MRLLLGAAASIGGPPAFALAVFLLANGTRPLSALALAFLTLLTGLPLAAIWARDIQLLADTLRYAAAEHQNGNARPSAPWLPPFSRLATAIERLTRTLAMRAAHVGELLRGNEAIIERLPDPLLVLARDGTVWRANSAAHTAFGPDMAAVIRHPNLREAIEHAFATRVPQVADVVVPVPVPRELQATVLVMEPPLASGGRAIAVFSDRTRERAIERMRADFVANASHELRTPLTSLIGFIDTLRGAAADDIVAQRRFLGIMAEQADRMNRLIDDLLSLSRIELSEHRAPSESVNVGPLAERLAAAFEPQVRQRRAELSVEIEAALPPIPADADQIEQLLQNLIENALKYGREGGTVRVRIERARAGTRWPARPGLVISVSDQGPGIPKEHIPRLTERFYRVAAARGKQVPGTGLGLAIVKHIVNRHRGQLVVESEVGKGSQFSVWLPQTVESEVARRRMDASGRGGSASSA